MIEERDSHSWHQLFPKWYLVNMLGKGTKSKSDAHLMRPSDVARTGKNLPREVLAGV